MEFVKNDSLVLNICRVLIRSVDGLVDIPQLQRVYHTPSRITWSNSSRSTADGNLHEKRLSLQFPGLGNEDFKKFDALVRSEYQVYVELDNGDYYEVASDLFPMGCSTDFQLGTGHRINFSSSSPFQYRYITTVLPGSDSEVPGLDAMFDYDFDFDLSDGS